jgi:hypothetical protein
LHCKRQLSSCLESTIRLSLSPLRIGCRMSRRDDDSVEQQGTNDDEKRMIPNNAVTHKIIPGGDEGTAMWYSGRELF